MTVIPSPALLGRVAALGEQSELRAVGGVQHPSKTPPVIVRPTNSLDRESVNLTIPPSPAKLERGLQLVKLILF